MDLAFEKFKASHIKLIDCLSEKQKHEMNCSFESLIEQKNINIRKINDILNTVEEVIYDTRSKGSVASSHHRRTIAALRLKNLKKKQELERQEDELRRKRELLDAEARLEEITLECENGSESIASEFIDPIDVPIESKTDKIYSWPTSNAYDVVSQAINEGFSLPKIELTTFSGNPVEYIQFIRSFEGNIESRTSDPRKILSYLIQFCTGEAKRAIECCRLLDPTHGVLEAKRILRERYGQPFVIAQSLLNQIVTGPEIKSSDQKALFELANDMESCKLTLTELGYVSEINASYNLRRITNRLPRHLKAKWLDCAGKIRDDGKEPLFDELFSFIRKSARNAVDPIYGGMTAEHVSIKKPVHVKAETTWKSKRMFITQSSGNSDSSIHYNNRRKTCADCSKDHDVVNCEIFRDRPLKEKLRIAHHNGLCYNCLIPRHTALECRKEKLCKVAGCVDIRKHDSLLHKDKRSNTISETKAETDATRIHTHLSASARTHVYFNVVPVRVSSPQSPVSFTTYAMLDSASDISVCTEKLLDKMNISGTSDEMTVLTIASKNKLKTKHVSLTVESLDRKESISLPDVWSVPKFQLSQKKIPKKEDFDRWPHLQGIDMNVYAVSEDEITLLIGADKPEAFITKEYRQGKIGQPIGMLGIFGWSLFGPSSTGLDASQEAKEYNVNLLQTHDHDLNFQIEKFWSLESLGLKFNDARKLSIEDRKAIDQMSSSIQLTDDQHYEMRLPWRDDSVHLPNNRRLAVKRLNQLLQRLARDPAAFHRYCNAINEYIDKGFASEITMDENKDSKDSIWYVPHHAVCHPQKPDKVRVVFDCAAECDGVSLNSKLLSGPDLTNSLVSVLLRFRKEQVAVVGDIEAMFHQVKVSPVDRDAFRFVWLANDDINSQPKDYRMNVHLFGATSSPSCANFALSQTAFDNQGRWIMWIQIK